MKRILTLGIACIAGVVAGCGLDMPGTPDGDGVVVLAVADTSGSIEGSTEGEPYCVRNASVSLQSLSHKQVLEGSTDNEGLISFRDLVAGRYSAFARFEKKLSYGKKVFTGYVEIEIEGADSVSDTILVSSVVTSNLMINEILYCGTDYSTFYFYDQFVELYNASDDTLYLDGIILTRNYPTLMPDMDTADFVRAIYAFQFPGTPVTGRQYPILPHDFVVIAADAVDHSAFNPKALDLSGADWECFNALGNDYDNPAVPNIVSIHPSSRIDYMINLSHNAVVIASGEEYGYEEYDEGKIRVTLPLYTVIDGVEYANTSGVSKELTLRVDAGFAGQGNTKYSGQSVERRELGFDTNNSTFDFVILPKSTPGYFHAQ